MILIGKKIKELRNKYKLTQTELATRLGVTKSTVAAYENDSRQPSYEVLVKMADVFKVTIDSILMDRSDTVINIEGLNNEQLVIIENLISHLRRGEVINTFFSKITKSKVTDISSIERLMKTHPEFFEDLEEVMRSIEEKNKKDWEY